VAKVKDQYLPYIWTPEDYFVEQRKEDIFPSSFGADLEVDLGCGEGGFLISMAQLYPERNFLGVERYLGRVCKVARQAESLGLSNIKLLRLDSAYALGYLLPELSVSRVHLICPDPWNKEKQKKKRIFHDRKFRDGLEGILQAEGQFLLKTDQQEYFESACLELSKLGTLTRVEWDETSESYPLSNFEEQWLSMGRTMHCAKWQRAASEVNEAA